MGNIFNMKNKSTQSTIQAVVAIDFGTTNSGYAYCLKKDEPIKTNPDWEKKGGRILTDILLDGKLTRALEFGPKALKAYTRAVQECFDPDFEWSDTEDELNARSSSSSVSLQDADLRDSVLLEKIKLQVLDLRVATNFQVKAVNGEKVHAVQAFASALKYMKECCMRQIAKDDTNLESRDILWIVTVPAAWEHEQRSFMTLAANDAKVMETASTTNFAIITESEASAHFCRALQPHEFTDPQAAACHQQAGSYIVVDAGGGTVDITLVSKNDTNKEETEVHISSGGKWGGETVNRRFEQHLLDSSKMIKCFREMYDEPMSLWKDFMADYTKAKHSANNKIQLKKEFVKFYKVITKKSLIKEFKKNDNIICDEEELTITLRDNCLRKKEFDQDFQDIKTKLESDQKLWKHFEKEFKETEREFECNKDRQFDVKIPLTEDFLETYKKNNRNVAFGTGPRIESQHSDTKVWFDKEACNLVIPSYAMKWCYYDDIMKDKLEPLEKVSKYRSLIWNKFMKNFEKAKRDFNGDSDVSMAIDSRFLDEFTSKCGAFGSDFESACGVKYVSDRNDSRCIQISSTIMKDICFERVTSKIIGVLKEFCRKNKNVEILYLVGGFGQQTYLQNLLKQEFEDIKVLVPNDAHASVMKGAINFAYSRVSTTSHTAPCTILVGKRRDYTGSASEAMGDSNQAPTYVTLVSKDNQIKISQIIMVETKPYESETKNQWIIGIYISHSTKDKAQLLTKFHCRNGKDHVVSISFTADDVRLFLNEKDTGNSQVKRIPMQEFQKEWQCLLM